MQTRGARREACLSNSSIEAPSLHTAATRSQAVAVDVLPLAAGARALSVTFLFSLEGVLAARVHSGRSAVLKYTTIPPYEFLNLYGVF